MSEASRAPNKNRILAALPEEDYQRVLVHLEPVEMKHGKVLYEIGDSIEYLYFPFNAMISLVTQMKDAKSLRLV